MGRGTQESIGDDNHHHANHQPPWWPCKTPSGKVYGAVVAGPAALSGVGTRSPLHGSPPAVWCMDQS